MNKIFKIVFNAARGKMMVVNEATSSVQTGKKAAVTVAVVAALACGTAFAAAPDFSSNAIVIDGIQVVENHNNSDPLQTINKEVNVSVTGSGENASLTIDTRIPKKHEAIRVWGNNLVLSIQNLNLLSIQGTGFLAGTHGLGQYDDSSVLFAGGNGTINVNVKTLKVGSESEVAAYGVGLNGQGGHIHVVANDVFMNLDGNAVWAQPTKDNKSNVSITAANNVTLKSNFAAVASGIYQDNPSAENSISVSAGNKLSITSVGNANAAVSTWDNNKAGNTSINLYGKNGVSIDCESGYGVRVNRDVASGNVDSSINISSDQSIEVGGGAGAVIVTSNQETAEAGISFEAPDITLNGDVDLTGTGSKLGLEGTATINGDVSAANSTVEVEGETIFNGNADIGTLDGDNAKLTLGDAASTVKVHNNNADKTTLGATGAVNDALGGNVDDLLAQFEGQAKSEGVAVEMAEGMTTGATTATVDENGKATNVVTKTNSIMSNTLDLASSAPLAMNRLLMNDVRKRMGDLRATEGTHGVWARYDGGKLSGANGLENEFTTVQVGIDTVPVVDAPRFGVAFAYTQSDADMKRGGAEMDAFSLAFYGTKFYDNGMFVDVIGRMATADTDVTVDGDKKGSMDNVALSLSGELGWHFNVTDKFFFEPQAELTYTYVNADTLTLSEGTSYEFDSVDSLLGRVGFAAGFKCPNDFGNVYVRASVVHEFLGDSTVRGGTAVYSVDGKDTWVEYGIGANFNVNKNMYVYADLERTEGAALEEDWRANVGVRFAF